MIQRVEECSEDEGEGVTNGDSLSGGGDGQLAEGEDDIEGNVPWFCLCCPQIVEQTTCEH